MNEREHLLVETALDRLRAFGTLLIEQGWRPELIVFAPAEIERIPGYKVALVVPIDAQENDAEDEAARAGAQPGDAGGVQEGVRAAAE